MIKTNLLKGLLIGLCMSALTTSAAFAQEMSTPASAGQEISAQDSELFAVQKDIDQVLFIDKVKEIEEKGFMVNYTGVAESYVEIGISPYSDANADYLYGLFGKDKVKVVEFDESIIYATSGPVDPVKEDVPVTDKEQMYANIDEPVANADGEVKVYKGEVAPDAAVVDDANKGDGEEIYYTTTSADAEEGNVDVQLLSEVEAFDAVKRGGEEETEKAEGVNAPMAVLLIAGAAVLVGGSILVNKKKTNK